MDIFTIQEEAYKRGYEAGVKSVTDNNVGDKMTPTDKDTNVPSKWIPVTERLPEPETEVLVCGKGCECASILTYRYDRHGRLKFMYVDDCGYWCEAFRTEVTHWMPLPEPPKGE